MASSGTSHNFVIHGLVFAIIAFAFSLHSADALDPAAGWTDPCRANTCGAGEFCVICMSATCGKAYLCVNNNAGGSLASASLPVPSGTLPAATAPAVSVAAPTPTTAWIDPCASSPCGLGQYCALCMSGTCDRGYSCYNNAEVTSTPPSPTARPAVSSASTAGGKSSSPAPAASSATSTTCGDSMPPTLPRTVQFCANGNLATRTPFSALSSFNTTITIQTSSATGIVFSLRGAGWEGYNVTLVGGKPVLNYNTGSGARTAIWWRSFVNDSRPHTVYFELRNGVGTLSVDGLPSVSGASSTALSVDGIFQFYSSFLGRVTFGNIGTARVTDFVVTNWSRVKYLDILTTSAAPFASPSATAARVASTSSVRASATPLSSSAKPSSSSSRPSIGTVGASSSVRVASSSGNRVSSAAARSSPLAAVSSTGRPSAAGPSPSGVTCGDASPNLLPRAVQFCADGNLATRTPFNILSSFNTTITIQTSSATGIVFSLRGAGWEGYNVTLVGGKPVLNYNTGSGARTAIWWRSFVNDSRPHTVYFELRNGVGTLSVDGLPSVSGASSTALSVDGIFQFYSSFLGRVTFGNIGTFRMTDFVVTNWSGVKYLDLSAPSVAAPSPTAASSVRASTSLRASASATPVPSPLASSGKPSSSSVKAPAPVTSASAAAPSSTAAAQCSAARPPLLPAKFELCNRGFVVARTPFTSLVNFNATFVVQTAVNVSSGYLFSLRGSSWEGLNVTLDGSKPTLRYNTGNGVRTAPWWRTSINDGKPHTISLQLMRGIGSMVVDGLPAVYGANSTLLTVDGLTQFYSSFTGTLTLGKINSQNPSAFSIIDWGLVQSVQA